MVPITKLMQKLEAFIWTPKFQEAWEMMKQKYMEAPILIAPNWDKEFHVKIDISNVAIGGMLTQNINNRCDQLITYDHGSSIMQIVNIQLQSRKHWQWSRCFTNSNITFSIISFSFM